MRKAGAPSALCLACGRGIALSLVVVSLPLAFEAGRHSVHHVSEPGQPSDCALAAEASRDAGDTAAAPADPQPVESAFARLATAPPVRIASAEYRPSRSRGPPLAARCAVVTG